jgi:hypothetical protein
MVKMVKYENGYRVRVNCVFLFGRIDKKHIELLNDYDVFKQIKSRQIFSSQSTSLCMRLYNEDNKLDVTFLQNYDEYIKDFDENIDFKTMVLFRLFMDFWSIDSFGNVILIDPTKYEPPSICKDIVNYFRNEKEKGIQYVNNTMYRLFDWSY